MREQALHCASRRRQRGAAGVLAALGVAAVAVAWLLLGAVAHGSYACIKQDRARLMVGQLRQGLDLYKLRYGQYPDEPAGLNTLVEKHCVVALQKDPWGNDYAYRIERGEPVVISYGDDGEPGGTGFAEDIASSSASL